FAAHAEQAVERHLLGHDLQDLLGRLHAGRLACHVRPRADNRRVLDRGRSALIAFPECRERTAGPASRRWGATSPSAWSPTPTSRRSSTPTTSGSGPAPASSSGGGRSRARRRASWP